MRDANVLLPHDFGPLWRASLLNCSRRNESFLIAWILILPPICFKSGEVSIFWYSLKVVLKRAITISSILFSFKCVCVNCQLTLNRTLSNSITRLNCIKNTHKFIRSRWNIGLIYGNVTFKHSWIGILDYEVFVQISHQSEAKSITNNDWGSILLSQIEIRIDYLIIITKSVGEKNSGS